MADGKIYITISDTRGGSGAGVSNDADTNDSNNPNSMLAKFAFNKMYHLIENEAKTFVNYSVGNIGNFTGNYQAQRDAQQGLNFLNSLISLSSVAITTFKSFGGGVQGGVAALIATAVTLAGQGTNIYLQEKTESFENKRTNRNIAMMRNRLGLEGLTDGSRSGGY